MHTASSMKYRWRAAMSWIVLPLYATYAGVRLLSSGWDAGTSLAVSCLIALVASAFLVGPRSAWLAGARTRPAAAPASPPADPAAVDPAAYVQARGL